MFSGDSMGGAEEGVKPLNLGFKAILSELPARAHMKACSSDQTCFIDRLYNVARGKESQS